MATLTQIRTALKDTIKAVLTDVEGYDTVPGVTQVPGFVVEPADANFTVAMASGEDLYELNIFMLVGFTDIRDAQTQLDQYVSGSGPKSIRQIVYNNSSLGLNNTDAMVIRMSGYGGHFQAAKIEHIGAMLRVKVTTSG